MPVEMCSVHLVEIQMAPAHGVDVSDFVKSAKPRHGKPRRIDFRIHTDLRATACGCRAGAGPGTIGRWCAILPLDCPNS